MGIYSDWWQKYLSLGLVPLPVQKGSKKPLVAWGEIPETLDIYHDWAEKYPDANIAVVIGEQWAVVDPDGTDAEAYTVALDLPLCPVSNSSNRSRHRWFKLANPMQTFSLPIGKNGSKFEVLTGKHLISVPPSIHPKTGKPYHWEDPLSIFQVEAPELPGIVLALNCSKAVSCTTLRAPAHASAMFQEGTRDHDLFIVANSMAKGGASEDEILQTLRILANGCNPPFPEKEVEEKFRSALKRQTLKDVNLKDEIRSYISVVSGRFSVGEASVDIQNRLFRLYPSVPSVNVGSIREAVRKTLWDMAKAGEMVRRSGDRNGFYERMESDLEKIDFLDAKVKPLEIRWPFQIEKLVRILPKNIVVVAGLPNAGKTAFLLNVVRLNMDSFKVSYFSSEMGDIELKDRLARFPVAITEWKKFEAYERASNFADVITPDGINVIDFLDVTKDFYLVAEMIKQIFEKLKKGVAIIALQKNPHIDYGLGGLRSAEKARLYLALEGHKCKIVKAKNWLDPSINPNNLEIEFRLRNGCEFEAVSDWEQAKERR